MPLPRDPTTYDEEANAWLPMQAYYATFWAIIAYAVASGQPIPKDHAAALKLAGKEVVRGLLPPPWDAWCDGCPQLGTCGFGGINSSGQPVHVLSTTDPWSSEDRLAMFLRTTRHKKLERRFKQARESAKPAPGRTRRNLPKAEKARMAKSMAPTTVFDVLWRMRKKANYEDADTFVLGAAGELDARRLGQALVIVADATIAALEAGRQRVRRLRRARRHGGGVRAQDDRRCGVRPRAAHRLVDWEAAGAGVAVGRLLVTVGAM